MNYYYEIKTQKLTRQQSGILYLNINIIINLVNIIYTD